MENSIVQENNFDKARKEIKKLKEQRKQIIFSGDDELNRKILEKEKINILLLNQSEKKDKLKQRNSGLNHVIAKLAKSNNVKIGINLDEIIESKGKQKADIFSRIKQNIKICNKNKLQMKFIAQKKQNERDIYDLKSLGLILGMPTWMVKGL